MTLVLIVLDGVLSRTSNSRFSTCPTARNRAVAFKGMLRGWASGTLCVVWDTDGNPLDGGRGAGDASGHEEALMRLVVVGSQRQKAPTSRPSAPGRSWRRGLSPS